jgi:hypothetical protein
MIKIPKLSINNIGARHIIETWEDRDKEIKSNLIEDSVENEENKYPLADPSRMMVSLSNEPNEVHKVMHNKELKTKLIEILM